ncbi:DUF4091 domain-containing protein [Leptolyngbya ohadii]|uniref:DUF4091 domain-containing protein n=1 Tax=Leptolyngbya ohadii TaxID=1962290 RepID=UPI000B59AE89|nr:DUF4091 domain-containing protein [Leptolyngbya ohadii]
MLRSSMVRKQIKPYLFGIFAIASFGLMVTLAGVNPLISDSSLPIPGIWTTSGMERMGMTDPPGSSTDISLSAAQGEYEPFQIGIRAGSSDLTNVNVAISDLTGPNNQTIPRANITLYREQYVLVDHPSPDLGGANRPLGQGWYADALIPFVDPLTGQNLVGASLDAAPFRVEAGKNQPVWVDVFVPRNTPAGQYQGTYTVTSNQGSRSGKINLNVWNFTLPLKASLNSVFLFHGDQTLQSATELLKHKLNPLFNGKTDLALERPLIDQWGMQSVGMRGFWSGAQQDNCQMSPAPTVAALQAEAAQHQPDLFKYVYSADEIGGCPTLYEPLKQWGRAIHQAGLSNLVTMAPVPELYDDGSGTGRSAVDVWVVLPKMYEQSGDRIREVQRKGDQVWSYNSLVQDNYSPKWQIDFAPINFRIQPGFISQSLGLTGLLYWRVDSWTSDPWNDIHTFFDRHDNNRPYPGDGMLVYPGQQVGVAGIVPSMRLKWIREGIEDYEYVQILKRLGRTERALEISRSVGSDWYNWTKSPAAIDTARRQLAQEIQK